MTKRKKAPKRKRGVPLQVYVSPDERADIRAIATKRGVSLSMLVRDWIRRSAAAAVARDPKPAAIDPRQLRIGDALSFTVLKEATAESQFVVVGVPCCDGPLVHIGIHDASCPNGLPSTPVES